ncbi:GntR family transcriptional regulator [Geomicrobium sp. JSM 1781026]|uniref:GntR family transcriptional regulator n=1 Tax=Geomicrobium sp. JSM 1781026 TaxID=3344580 RepID=UPI0035BF81C1
MDRSKSLAPLHFQIKTTLRDEIRSGVYVEKIPSERDLMARFSVSRTTIREAVTHLVQDGVLTKVHGKGTFISQSPPVQEWLDSLSSLTETVENMGRKPGALLLDHGFVTKEPKISSYLQSDHLYYIKRLRTVDGEPMAIERHFYEVNLGLALAEFDLNEAVIYQLLEDELTVDLYEAEQTISVKPVQHCDAINLDLGSHQYALHVERLMTNRYTKPIEYYLATFHPDRYELRMKTQRKKGGERF